MPGPSNKKSRTRCSNVKKSPSLVRSEDIELDGGLSTTSASGSSTTSAIVLSSDSGDDHDLDEVVEVVQSKQRSMSLGFLSL